MKKSFFLFISALLLVTNNGFSQSRFIKNVARDVKNEILGSGGGSSPENKQPEPSCACSDAQQILGMGEHKLMYSEIDIRMLDDGSFLVQDRLSQKYYVIRNGEKQGPYDYDDPKISVYTGGFDENTNPLTLRYKEYISQSGDKYTIRFDGKTYGPYARIDNFVVTQSRDKFAATTVDNVIATEDEGRKMEEAMENAKSDQERMELAMQFSQQMTQRMMAGGGTEGVVPKLVTNIENANYNPGMGGILNSGMKYDDIVYIRYTDIMDLRGNKLTSVKPEHAGMDRIFITSDNSGYAAYGSGTLYLSDGKTMSDLFNPQLVKTDGRIQLSYMYYSPKKDAIMQCRIPF